jgi:hypothetical protein
LVKIRLLRLRLIGALVCGGLTAAAIYLVGQTEEWTRFYVPIMGAPIAVATAAGIGFSTAEEAVATHRTVRFVIRTAVLLIAVATLAGGIALEIRFRLDAQAPAAEDIGAAGLQWAILASLFNLPQSLVIAVPVVAATTFTLRALLRRYWAALGR